MTSIKWLLFYSIVAIGCESNLKVKTSTATLTAVEPEGSNVAAKLMTNDCLDPDLNKIPTSVSLTLCNGEIGQGLLELRSEDIKAGITYADVSGSVIESPGNCSADGASNCVVDGTIYKAASVAHAVATNIKTGATIAGVSGSVVESPLACSSDGGVGCVVVGPTFKAAAMGNFTAGSIRSGVTVAGVAGSLLDCATNGVMGCVTTSTYKSGDLTNLAPGNVKDAVTIAGVTGTLTFTGPGNCVSDGEQACIVDGSTYKAAAVANLVNTNIKTGVTIGGVAGNVTPTPANCATDGESACVVNGTDYKAAKLTNFGASDVRSGVTIAGVGGSLGNCADGGSGCFVQGPTYKAVVSADLTAGNIKTGATIGGIAGGYPSITYPLTGNTGTTDLPSLAASVSAGSYEWFKSDGTLVSGTITDASTITPGTTDQNFTTSVYRQFTVTGDADLVAGKIKSGVNIFGAVGDYPSATYPLAGADSTDDLDGATFDAKIKSASSFEWFTSAGTRYTHSGDADIAAGNIANGVTIFGEMGTLVNTPCTGDGQTGCLTTSRYQSADTNAYTVWDIRKGKTVGGMAGEITFHKNMANTTLFDRNSDGLDIYDTIDDYNNGGAFPTQNNTGWDQATGANWLRESTSDNGVGSGGVAADGLCNGTEGCIFTDRLTGLSWTSLSPMYTWDGAITGCDALTTGGFTDWRLATQKELMQSYMDGIWYLKGATKLNLTTDYYWSSTTLSTDTTRAFVVLLDFGSTGDYLKTDSTTPVKRATCVRP